MGNKNFENSRKKLGEKLLAKKAEKGIITQRFVDAKMFFSTVKAVENGKKYKIDSLLAYLDVLDVNIDLSDK